MIEAASERKIVLLACSSRSPLIFDNVGADISSAYALRRAYSSTNLGWTEVPSIDVLNDHEFLMRPKQTGPLAERRGRSVKQSFKGETSSHAIVRRSRSVHSRNNMVTSQLIYSTTVCNFCVSSICWCYPEWILCYERICGSAKVLVFPSENRQYWAASRFPCCRQFWPNANHIYVLSSGRRCKFVGRCGWMFSLWVRVVSRRSFPKRKKVFCRPGQSPTGSAP